MPDYDYASEEIAVMRIKSQLINILDDIGRQLDRNVFPVVKNGGIVLPSETAVIPLDMGKEKEDGRERQRGSESRSRKRATRGEGEAGGSRPAGCTSSLISTDLRAAYESQLGEVLEAYPSTKVWHQSDGLWLLVESCVLEGLSYKALFLICIPFHHTSMVRAWAYWGIPLSEPTWIGPRHTNYPDGSICAFEPKDGTWAAGNSIVKLLDIYTLWALRHLHLNEFGKWPGYQSVHHPYERLTEIKKNEYCGCDSSNKKYVDCCYERDKERNMVADAVGFIIATGGIRKPPRVISDFINNKISPPEISEIM